MYPYRVNRWLDGDPGQPAPPAGHRTGRNAGWRHLDSFDVLAMPDPWEYPWFAAWDLAFHTDPVGAPGPGVRQVPAAGAAAGVVPAPERGAARVRVELRRRQPAGARAGRAPGVRHRRRHRHDFLERVFQKLLLNFTWWLNRQDPDGNNLFGGGFLGLDNISPIDRSHLPPGIGWSRPTAPRGWRTTRSPCSPWRSPWPSTTPSTRTWSSSSRTDRADHGRVGGLGLLRPGGRLLLRPAHRRRRNQQPDPGADPGRGDPGAARDRAQPTGEPTGSGGCASGSPAGWSTGRPARDAGLAGPRHRRHPAAAAVRRPAGPAAPDARPPCSTRTRSCPRTGCGRSPSGTAPPTRCPALPDAAIRVRARRIPHRDVRRQLQLARTGVVPGQLPGHPGAAAVRPVLRPGLHHRVPDRIRAAADACGRSPATSPTGWSASGCPDPTAADPSTAASRSCRPTRRGRTTCCSTSTSTATTAPASAPCTRPGGPPWSPTCCIDPPRPSRRMIFLTQDRRPHGTPTEPTRPTRARHDPIVTR